MIVKSADILINSSTATAHIYICANIGTAGIKTKIGTIHIIMAINNLL